MTLAFNDRYVSITAAPGQTELPYDFRLTRPDGIFVYLTRDGVTSTLTYGLGDFSFPDGLGGQSGGSLTLTDAAEDGDVYELVGMHPEDRLSDFAGGLTLPSPKLNGDGDALTIIAQEHRRDIDRSIKMPFGVAGGQVQSNIGAGHFMVRATNGVDWIDGGDGEDIANAQEYAAQVAAAVAGLVFSAYKLRADAQAVPGGIPAAVKIIWLSGTTAAGDAGIGFYERLVADPGSGTRFQDAAGAWWALFSSPAVAGPALVADRTAMKALDTAVIPAAYLKSFADAGMFHWVGADLSATIVRATVASSAVNQGTETITSVAHGLKTGHVVFPTLAVNGLTAEQPYFVIRVTADTFRLASSFANALAGTAVNLNAEDAVTVKRILDPKEGVYVIPTGKEIDGSQGAFVRGTARHVTPYMFGAAGNKGAGDTDDREALFAADEYCLAVNATLDIDPNDHYVDPATPLVLYAADYYLPWGSVTIGTADDWFRIITIAPDAAVVTLEDGTYESPIFTSPGVGGDFNYHTYLLRNDKGIRIVAENDLAAIWKTPVQLKNCSDTFFTGILFHLVNDQQLLNIWDGTLYLDDCSANAPAGTRPNRVGGFMIARLANIFVRALTVNCTYNFTTCSGVIASPPFDPGDADLGLKVGNYMQINYSTTFWAAPSADNWIRILSGNTNGGGFIISITQGFMYLHNTSVVGTAKGDGSICVGVQRGAQLRLVQDTATDFALGMREATTGVALTGGGKVTAEGGANSGNDAMAFINLTTGMSRTGGGVGDISYETAQTDFTGTTTPTSVSGAWTAV